MPMMIRRRRLLAPRAFAYVDDPEMGMGPAEGVPPPDQPMMLMDDAAAMQVLALWRELFTDVMPLPQIGLPSQNPDAPGSSTGVLTFTHTMSIPGMAPPPPMTINGLPTKSALGNNALGSMEVSNGRWLCLYETMLPDIAGTGGAPSSSQRYVDTLQAYSVEVAGNHYHWSGGRMMGHFAVAIHSQATGNRDPIQFTQAHLAAFREFLSALAPSPSIRSPFGSQRTNR